MVPVYQSWFLSSNAIEHWKSSPYHLSSNGLAKKAMQIVKQRNEGYMGIMNYDHEFTCAIAGGKES